VNVSGRMDELTCLVNHKIDVSLFQCKILKSTYLSMAPFVSWKVVSWKPLFKLFYVCLLLEKLVDRKHFTVKGKFDLVFRKYFPFILSGKHFPEVVKILKISCYLLIISNLVLKLLIVIYFVLNFFFNFIL